MKGKRKNKSKDFPNKEKAKTNQPMNNVIQIEDRVSRSRSKHEGESSASLCDRLSRTREVSQRQLPTDHDYAVPTREYQLDQSSPLPATAAADPVLEKTNTKTTPTIRPRTPCSAAILRFVTYLYSFIPGQQGSRMFISYGWEDLSLENADPDN